MNRIYENIIYIYIILWKYNIYYKHCNVCWRINALRCNDVKTQMVLLKETVNYVTGLQMKANVKKDRELDYMVQ